MPVTGNGTDTTAGGNSQALTPSAAPAGKQPGADPALTNNTAGGSPTAGGQNGQAPTATPPQPSDDGASAAPPSADEWKRVQQELAESRREAAKFRNELKTRDDALLTAEQKRERDYSDLQTRAAEQELRLQRLHLENAGYRLGASLGIGDLTAALAILQVEHGHEIAFDDNGAPTNLADLMKTVLEQHPVLAAQTQPPQPPQPPQQQQSPAAYPAYAPSAGATNPPRSGQIAGANGYFGRDETRISLTDPRLWRKS